MFTMEYVSANPIFNPNDALRDRWKAWINKAYIDWRGESRSSIADFARYLGITPQLMNGWMNYGSIPSSTNLQKMGRRLPYVYDFFELPRPVDPIDELLALVPEDFRAKILDARAEYSAELTRRGIEIDSPEAREIVMKAFSKRGLKVTVSE